MQNSLHMEITPKKSETLADVNLEGEFKGRDFTHAHFKDVNGLKAVFVECNFSYCTFERTYFREAVFTKCRFVGARFTDCNLRAARLESCALGYATFRGTLLERQDFLANLPSYPNVQAELLRSLRTNAQGLGDVKSVNTFVRAELEAEREHWRRARKRSDVYYSKKYGSPLQRVRVYYQGAALWLDSFLWGHGEHPWRVARSVLILLLVFSLAVMLDRGQVQGRNSLAGLGSAAVVAFWDTALLFVGAPHPPSTPAINVFLTCVIVGSRFVAISLFVGIIFRRMSRR